MRNTALAFRFALREMKSGFHHFRILLLCLVLGVAAIAAVQSLSRSLLDSLSRDGRQILGGDLSVRTMGVPVSAEMQEQLRNFGRLTVSLETHTMIRSGAEDASMLAELKAFDAAYPLYGRVVFTDGAGNLLEKTPQEITDRSGTENLRGTAVEAEALERLGLSVGEILRIGTERFRVNALIRHEPDRLGTTRYAIAPRVMIALDAVEESGFHGFGNLLYYHHRLALPGAQTLQQLEQKKAELAATAPREESWRVYSFPDAAPGLRRAVERLNIFLTLMGLTALLIGGIGIGNATTAYLQRKYGVIAALKCLGGAQEVIFRTYLIQMLLVAVPGIAAGLLLGAAVPQFVMPLLAGRLDLTAQAIGIYPDILVQAAVYGFLISFMFVIWPVAKACRVRAADLFRSRVSPAPGLPEFRYAAVIAVMGAALIALIFATVPEKHIVQYFLYFSFTSLIVFLLLSETIRSLARKIRIRNKPSLRMAIVNLYRPGNTTTSVMMSMGFGMAVMVMIAMLQANFAQVLERDAHEAMPAFYFLDVQPDQKDGFLEAVASTSSAELPRILPVINGRVVRAKGMAAQQALVRPQHAWVMRGDRRFTYAAEDPGYGTFVEGTWWASDYRGPPLVSVSMDVAQAFDMHVGDTLTVDIFGEEVTARVANIRDINWSSFTMNFAMTFSPAGMEDFPASYVSTVVVDEQQELDLQNRIARDFPNIISVRLRDILAVAQDIMGLVAQAVRYGAVVTILVGLLVLQGGILSGQQQRLYDSVVLKVLGITRQRLGRVFLVEYGVLAFVVMIVASVLGCVLSYGVFEIIMELNWRFYPRALIEISLLCIALTLGIGYWNIRRILSVRPAVFLRQD
ncbi:MAG: FtsX-like permease family protein [Pseudomonadota bacterium]|nr:FtsX-like permease family protein [Pseudomonadota bacterium]QKK05956.1 MAG: FtsX-like permease family protein [Pseudomonadota bacterium]